MNKFLQISIWSIAIVLVVVALGFVNKSQERMELKKPIINIDYETENRFIDEQDVLAQIINQNDTIPLLMKDINVNELEKKINSNAAIKSAEIYKTINGNLVVDVKQRRPIVRVFSKNGSYYIDEKGMLMPISNKYTSRLLVVNGVLNEPFAKRYKFNYANLNDTLKSKTLLDDIYKISKYIDESEFWKAQIEQVYVNKDLEFDLVPKVGNHKIVFGGVQNLGGKFEKLMIFYKKGLNKTGWNEYSTINLKYKNQVVCTKMYD
jgi:cell division protein FtsQ